MGAGCASCGGVSPAVGTTFFRCSRCKWVSYCSKDCQLRHWKEGGHRKLCATLRKVAAFRDAETRFWHSRSQSELEQFARDEGLEPASMRFYGEVLFVLVGLKPCLLFSNLPRSWRIPFARDVIAVSGITEAATESPCLVPVSLFVVSGNLQTPAEYSVQDTLVLANTSHPTYTSMSGVLRLHGIPMEDGELQSHLQRPPSDDRIHLVGEAQLAYLLDYPVALDECVDPMIEVGYFAIHTDGTRRLLLSYCANAIASHASRIRTHFHRYRDQFDAATLAITMETTRL